MEHLLQSLSYDHLHLVTLFRYDLINNISRLKSEIENNLMGTGHARIEDYTEDSWTQMQETLTSAQAYLTEEWQYNLADEVLEVIYEHLLSGLNGLELIPQSEPIVAADLIESASGFDFNQTFRLGTFILGGLIGIILIVKIVRFIQERRYP